MLGGKMNSYKEIYRAEQFPVFQNRMFNSEEEARNCVKGDILLVQDLETGLVFNQAFNPGLMQYDADYQNEQAVSDFFQQHLRNVAGVIQKHFKAQSLIEVGCGKGHFLENLQALGFQITGLDPTYEGQNPTVIKEYFTPETGIQADGIILRHVLEHVQEPVGFLSEILASNGGFGRIYIEVPCLDWIAKQRAWFDIFYEHVNYFRLSDFHRIFGTIYESGHTFGGQYLYVVADLSTIRKPVFDEPSVFDLPKDFLRTVVQHASTLKAQSETIVWGGASKGVIFALLMHRAGSKVDFVIDINPAKQGRYLAGTGLRVYSPEEALQNLAPGTNVFVMNSNYLSEIIDLTENKFNYLRVDHESL
jgi:Methyltransferase domain/C-methyltransferase C-terminal domain